MRKSSPLPVRAAHTRAIALGEQAAGDEPENLRRALIEPLRVVDDGDERLLVGDRGEQRQRGEPHQEWLRRRTDAQSEHGRERFALRDRQPLEVIEHGRTELVEAAVGELHFRLDAEGRCDVPAFGAIGQVAQQRALAHARLAPQDHDATPAGERVAQQPVERVTLGLTSDESDRQPPPGRTLCPRSYAAAGTDVLGEVRSCGLTRARSTVFRVGTGTPAARTPLLLLRPHTRA